MHRALSLPSDADVESPVLRRECYSAERRWATGFGLMTSQEMYEADLRVRRGAQQEAPVALPTATGA
jgi:hypothetical protein